MQGPVLAARPSSSSTSKTRLTLASSACVLVLLLSAARVDGLKIRSYKNIAGDSEESSEASTESFRSPAKRFSKQPNNSILAELAELAEHRQAFLSIARSPANQQRRGFPQALAQRSGAPGALGPFAESAEVEDREGRALLLPNPPASLEEAFCDFGPLPAATLCEWQDGCGALKWIQGTGISANWYGGPLVDASAGSADGGYAFVDTSYLPPSSIGSVSPNGRLHSPQLASTGVTGTCFTFKFAMDGLSAAGLRVHLHAGRDDFSSTVTRANGTAPVTMSCDRPSGGVGPAQAAPAVQSSEQRILWNAHYHVLGTWQQVNVLYTFPDIHSLILEGIPVDSGDPSRLYRGYIAIDDIDLQATGTSCIGFCNFAGGFCDWTNDPEDDFDWSISRGSSNPTTGPAMDRDKTLTNGGYAFIDSSYPRRPGDVAKLVSTNFPASATDMPSCLHFSFHMFGSGIGELKLSLRHFRNLDSQLQEIWKLHGNAGNSWFDSRVTVSSIDDYQLVFEASVGNTAMGDIAIDDISLTTGPCPTSPQVAAPPEFPRDCTFEIDECEWFNSREPASVIPTPGIPTKTRVDWERVSQATIPPRNQRKLYTLPSARPRQDFFMALQTKGNSPNAAGTAYLVSNEIKGTMDPVCVSFWYLMFESFIDAGGPSLGVLRVLIQLADETPESAVPIWQIYNNQAPTWNYGQASINEKRNFHVLFEGTWGPNRAKGHIAIDDVAFYTGNCTIRPASAVVRPQDCSFEKGLCGWENVTTGGTTDPRIAWQRAYPTHRPAQLLDKTFGSSGDFIFFDIFSPNQKREVRLKSSVVDPLPEEESVCFTFWFVAFGVEESTALRIIKHTINQEANASPESSQDDEEQQVIWSLTAKGLNNLRPSWSWAQVSVETRSPYQIILEGSASNGGFAIDDIKFQSQNCPTRPSGATAQSSSASSREF